MRRLAAVCLVGLATLAVGTQAAFAG
ncbi:MAG: hypothetical protein QOH10_978, partial [Actinomycetota bacterium]|nr:hypothetical protein [Actinomycetota bacterium]